MILMRYTERRLLSKQEKQAVCDLLFFFSKTCTFTLNSRLPWRSHTTQADCNPPLRSVTVFFFLTAGFSHRFSFLFHNRINVQCARHAMHAGAQRQRAQIFSSLCPLPFLCLPPHLTHTYTQMYFIINQSVAHLPACSCFFFYPPPPSLSLSIKHLLLLVWNVTLHVVCCLSVGCRPWRTCLDYYTSAHSAGCYQTHAVSQVPRCRHAQRRRCRTKGKRKGRKKTKTNGPQAWSARDNNGLRKLRGFEMRTGKKRGGRCRTRGQSSRKVKESEDKYALQLHKKTKQRVLMMVSEMRTSSQKWSKGERNNNLT